MNKFWLVLLSVIVLGISTVQVSGKLGEEVEMSDMQIKLGLYKHYKGNLYQVVGIARHSESLEPLVVYQALYSSYGLWVRPAKMFTEKVMINGKEVARFAFQGAGVTQAPEVK